MSMSMSMNQHPSKHQNQKPMSMPTDQHHMSNQHQTYTDPKAMALLFYYYAHAILLEALYSQQRCLGRPLCQ